MRRGEYETLKGLQVNRRNSLRSQRYSQTALHGLTLNTKTSHWPGMEAELWASAYGQ